MISLIAQVIDKVITILIFAIVIRAFLSFLPQFKSNKLSMLLYDVTDPLLKPFQRFQIGGAAGAIDFSPIIAIIALNLIQDWIVRPFIF
ncbi:MAG TPA: YggT family protein [Desulfosporosinus sp.]|nr:YggT family protein [Desulfosporosinus sp.]